MKGMEKILRNYLQGLAQVQVTQKRGVPWLGFKRPPEQFAGYAARENGDLRILSNRVYVDTGKGWRAQFKPVSRRKQRILARRKAVAA